MTNILSVFVKQKPLFFLVVFVFAYLANAQKHFSGIILDTQNQPIPYAHLLLPDLGVGTIANDDGRFTLYLPKGYPHINKARISCIGYITRTVSLSDNFEKIVLQEDVLNLAEIVITPKNYALEIVEKAIKNIEINYPDSEEMHTGFYREQCYWDYHKKQPIYVAESVLESHKKSYKKPEDTGSVRLKKGRKFEALELDSLPTRFYGGSHDAHRLDIVARRFEVLSNPSKFDLEIIDTLRFESENVFKIHFSKGKNLKGYLMILDSSYAIIKANFHRTNFSGLMEAGDRKSRDFTVTYSQSGAKWRLKSILFESAFEINKRAFYVFSEYVTNNVTETFEEIPYPERIQYGDVFLEHTGDYDSTFWNNYNIISSDSQTEYLFKQQSNAPVNTEETELTKRGKLFKVLNRIRSSLAIEYTPITQNSHSVSFSNEQFSINESPEANEANAINLSSAIQYEWKKSLFIGFSSKVSITDPSNSVFDLQIIKEMNLNPKGRPITLSPGMAFGYQQVSRKIGNFESQSNFRVNGKKFDSGHTDISLQQRGFRLLPSLSFGIEKSHRLQYFISAGYNIPIQQKTGLYFDETDQFFLMQKNAFLKNGEEGLIIQSTSNPFENSWTFSAGVYLSF